MKNPNEIEWLAEPEEHNYPAAASYLSLIYAESKVELMIINLRKSTMSEFKRKIYSVQVGFLF